jgi:hypothetical protein
MRSRQRIPPSTVLSSTTCVLHLYPVESYPFPRTKQQQKNKMAGSMEDYARLRATCEVKVGGRVIDMGTCEVYVGPTLTVIYPERIGPYVEEAKKVDAQG